MSKTRDNHYVPQWYQKGFLKNNSNKLCYLDLYPDQKNYQTEESLLSMIAIIGRPQDVSIRLTFIQPFLAFTSMLASSIMKCNTWESRKENAILSVYGKEL